MNPDCHRSFFGAFVLCEEVECFHTPLYQQRNIGLRHKILRVKRVATLWSFRTRHLFQAAVGKRQYDRP